MGKEKKGETKPAEKKAPMSAEEKKAAKKARMENAGPRAVVFPLSTETGTEDRTKTGKANPKAPFVQHVSHVRGMGVMVTTTTVDPKGNPLASSTTWIPGLKPKSKNGERYLIADKGPKQKKPKADAAAPAEKKKKK